MLLCSGNASQFVVCVHWVLCGRLKYCLDLDFVDVGLRKHTRLPVDNIRDECAYD